MSDIEDFKKLAGSANETLSSLRPGVEDVLVMGRDLTQAKVNQMEKISKVMERFKGKQSANEIFTEFGKDAAECKVVEMIEAPLSGDRQRASETILAYHLGKPVERTVSLNAQIGNMDKNEIVSKILEVVNQIGINVGIEGGIRKTSALIIDSEEPLRRESSEELSTPSAENRNNHSKLSRKISTKPKSD